MVVGGFKPNRILANISSKLLVIPYGLRELFLYTFHFLATLGSAITVYISHLNFSWSENNLCQRKVLKVQFKLVRSQSVANITMKIMKQTTQAKKEI